LRRGQCYLCFRSRWRRSPGIRAFDLIGSREFPGRLRQSKRLYCQPAVAKARSTKALYDIGHFRMPDKLRRESVRSSE
jgi:hypothetical protein